MIYLAAIAAFILGHASAWLFARLYVRAKRNQWGRQEKALRQSAAEHEKLANYYAKLYLEAIDDPIAAAVNWDAGQGRLAKDLMEAKR